MSKIMTLPKIGVNMTEAMIARWLVKVGDQVSSGDAIMEAETDKAVQEIFATESGIVAQILREEGETVQCHEDILVLADEEENAVIETPGTIRANIVESPITIDRQALLPVIPQPTASSEISANRPSSNGNRKTGIRISPLAKKLAFELGIKLSDLEPAIPGQRITKNDVFLLSKHAKPVQVNVNNETGDDILLMSSIRKIIASRMLDSSQNRPTVPLTLTTDIGALLSLRKRYKQKNIKISIDALMVFAVSRLLADHRQLNSSLENSSIILKRSINIGVAIDTPKGLTVPVIKNADRKRLVEIALELSEMTVLAIEGKLAAENISGGTFTITNLGMFGIEEFVPIINPPECCILAIGAIKQRFVPDSDGKPILQDQMKMTLVFDHRIVDGAPAAKFLKELKGLLEMPELLL